MEKLATDTYKLEKLINNGFTYVDKTDRLLPLVDMSIGKQFSKIEEAFQPNPRRAVFLV